jgi:LysM repeat protein
MPETQHNVQDVLDSYRRRRGRLIPALLGALAVLLLVAGIILIVTWLTGSNPPSLPAFLASDTPTPTWTPVPPTATYTLTPTVAPTETPTPIGERTYIVQLNDNLWTIAADYEIDILVLMEANGITNPDQISVGQELIIPVPGTERATPTALPETLVAGTRIEYIVLPGDTLLGIASRFNSTAEAIAEASEIGVTDIIGPGQRLIVPVGIATPTTTATPGRTTPTRTLVP